VSVAVVEVGDMGVGVFDGIVAVPMGVTAVHPLGMGVGVVAVVVAMFVVVLNDRVMVGVLVRGAQR
jgi:hypothetical protein